MIGLARSLGKDKQLTLLVGLPTDNFDRKEPFESAWVFLLLNSKDKAMKAASLVSPLLILLTWACGPNGERQALVQQKAEQDSLWKALMQVHDDVMPEMSKINQLANQIEEVLKNDNLPQETRSALENTLVQLQSAGDDMWTWMASLKVLPNLRKDSLSHEEIMASLRKDQKSITKVSGDMQNSIAKAQEILDKLEQAVPVSE